MSKTYLGVIVILLAELLPWLGLEIANDDITNFVSVSAQIIGAIVAFYGRYRLGGVNAAGLRDN